ncbi:GNAT family N-acetyltransferase [Janibacter limosus]|uniref:GNAT family N-acetyltransferase n=1 Tax=Janibacter limosus TaxID=53458 RepID=UPI0035DF873D|nr:GNAT family N-acetyltransferase [Janibacter limosus]
MDVNQRPVHLRPVEREDAFSLAALRLQQDKELGRATRDRFVGEYADAFLEDFTTYRGWLAEQGDGRPVGCLLALRVRKLPTLARTGRPEWWYVQQVFVSTDRRREGIGRRLVHAARDAASAERVRWLRLNASDAGAPLFDAMGFGDPMDRLREWVPGQAP